MMLLTAMLAAGAQTYDTNRGFLHPGGLHTQADFDRIKAQLAAGNPTVTAAFNVLRNAAYAQSDVQTYPVETIVRGGGNGENYINAARGATMAYQNALMWRITGEEAHAQAAVRVLMAWAGVTRHISGDSNYALAAGLYGYEFAQAAELVRDYSGWQADSFARFKRWMLDVWYPSAIGFLRSRNGTWENNGKWWQAPGHYWSNWGLCNALCVMSIGVLCDDVFIYNQGLSFIKYDQVGTFQEPRTASPILNDGLTEFWGNLIVTHQPSDMETGAYGQLGQMQESGRDIGHATMALGLAVDIAHMAWNQGDDLFAYMDNRLAAGIEYVAAQTQGIEGLPWTDYKYGTSGIYYTDSRCWTMTAPALGEQIRPYWGTVIGHYEGILGVRMPFSEWSYAEMTKNGPDGGGQGSTSGGYDHLGYSVLMNTYDSLAPANKVPTSLTGRMQVDGNTIDHTELGGLKNTYQNLGTSAEETGKTVILMPQLPDGEEDTGLWQWNTGATTRNLTVTTDHSHAYRVTYTNKNGIQSHQLFTIAAKGDCQPSAIASGSMTVDGTVIGAFDGEALYGSKVSMTVNGLGGFGSCRWDDGTTASTRTITLRRDTTIRVSYINQGGAATDTAFHIKTRYFEARTTIGSTTYADSLDVITTPGQRITLIPFVPSGISATCEWGDGSTGRRLSLGRVETSNVYTARCSFMGRDTTVTWHIFVTEDTLRAVAEGDYLLREYDTGRLLTLPEGASRPSFQPVADATSASMDETTVWTITRHATRAGLLSYKLMAKNDSTYLRADGRMGSASGFIFRFTAAAGQEWYNIFRVTSSDTLYWDIHEDGSIDFDGTTTLRGYPIELVPATVDGIRAVGDDRHGNRTHAAVYDLQGRRVASTGHWPEAAINQLPKGIYIVNGHKVVVR